MHAPDVPINGESIKLGQFLKLANLAETGGEAKELIASGLIRVNGETETRRGRSLHLGDVVAVIDPTSGSALSSGRVSAAEDIEDYFDESTADDDFDPEKWRNL
ncbi:RNA-binding protein [Corynebacterium poyangense]|uniref:RNA-binding protein n=1 Tax=Corynebacterium poyangense TaxID=2684405 RepID=A0A7H0SLA7_9CORY|nr:RNA-binding S4 domain-containing protein [Corynebacterium poyangense]MBZ8177423.1 RNA-binding protein [Corynebacterium poyangense]QNQ89332.1 RNA-binding protein [Corynebacterium poyangense]